MYAFGLNCAATGRFDTCVPNRILGVLGAISRDQSGDAYWRRPEVYPHLKVLCESYTVGGWGGDASYWQSIQAAAAYRCGQRQEAKRLLDALGAKVSAQAFSDMDKRLDQVRADLYPGAGRP